MTFASDQHHVIFFRLHDGASDRFSTAFHYFCLPGIQHTRQNVIDNGARLFGAWDVIRNHNDIGKLLRESKITRIFATGGKSAQLYRKLIEPKTGVPITQLPSTSPANAAWSLERLIEAYRVIL